MLEHNVSVHHNITKVVMNTSFHKLTGGILGREEWRIHLAHSHIPKHIHTNSYGAPLNFIILNNQTGERIKWRASLIELFWGPLKFCWPFYGTLDSKLQLSNPIPSLQAYECNEIRQRASWFSIVLCLPGLFPHRSPERSYQDVSNLSQKTD